MFSPSQFSLCHVADKKTNNVPPSLKLCTLDMLLLWKKCKRELGNAVVFL